LQLGHGAIVQRIGDIEPLEENRGVALGFVAVLVADNPLGSPRRIPSASVMSVLV